MDMDPGWGWMAETEVSHLCRIRPDPTRRTPMLLTGAIHSPSTHTHFLIETSTRNPTTPRSWNERWGSESFIFWLLDLWRNQSCWIEWLEMDSGKKKRKSCSRWSNKSQAWKITRTIWAGIFGTTSPRTGPSIPTRSDRHLGGVSHKTSRRQVRTVRRDPRPPATPPRPLIRPRRSLRSSDRLRTFRVVMRPHSVSIWHRRQHHLRPRRNECQILWGRPTAWVLCPP